MAEQPITPVRRAGRPRIVAAAVESARRTATIRTLNQVVAAGGSALLVTADSLERPEDLAPEVEMLDLSATERRLGLNRLLTRDPARLLARFRGTRISGPSPAWVVVRRSKPYRMIRPWLLWRALRRHLAEVRIGDVDHVIIVHQNSWPIAWQLHRRNPAVSIAYEVPAEVWERAGRPVPPPPSVPA
ncbi:MAG: hypothetical protein QG622_2567 [Actinomycetota bacterium]|nr:hypothetical protein [Actinomycetota bacterium]